MINPAALIAAPIAATSIRLSSGRGIEPADLWKAGADLTADELSALLEDCTGYTVDADTDADGDPAFYLVDPSGERLEPDYPYPDLEAVEDVVSWRIDEALAGDI